MSLKFWKCWFRHKWEYATVNRAMAQREVTGYRRCLRCHKHQLRKPYYSGSGWKLSYAGQNGPVDMPRIVGSTHGEEE